ncbi:hypothetical protein HK097_005603, partial [Rhizophlyctis rosea]
MSLDIDLPLLPASTLPLQINQAAERRRRKKLESVPCKVPRTNDFQCLMNGWDVPGGQHFHLRRRKRGLFDADGVLRREGVEELERGVRDELQTLNPTDLSPHRIATLMNCFERVISHFTTHSSLLSDIKQEYTLLLTSLHNLHSESAYLRTKIQGLLSENGSERMIDEERTKILELSFRIEMLRKENVELERLFIGEEEQYVLSLAEAYRKDVRNASDEKTRITLQHQGRWNYIEDWLEKGAAKEPIIRETLQNMRKT